MDKVVFTAVLPTPDEVCLTEKVSLNVAVVFALENPPEFLL